MRCVRFGQKGVLADSVRSLALLELGTPHRFRLWHWLRKRPVSESGRLRQGARIYLPGERRRRGIVLPML